MNNNIAKYGLITASLFGLISIRYYESFIFDDGLIQFFKHDYIDNNLPQLSLIKVLLIDSARFWINSLLSIVIILLLFSQKQLRQFLALFYIAVYLFSLIVFIYAFYNYEASHYINLFYARRVLIQPLGLFILIPALIYQKKEVSK